MVALIGFLFSLNFTCFDVSNSSELIPETGGKQIFTSGYCMYRVVVCDPQVAKFVLNSYTLKKNVKFYTVMFSYMA